MSEELKGCPSVICGSGDVTISTFARRLWIVECNECHARTRPHGIKEEAITDWNTRHKEANCQKKLDSSKGEERDITCPKCKTHKMERIGSLAGFYSYFCSDHENCMYHVEVSKETGKVFHAYGINPTEGSDREEMPQTVLSARDAKTFEEDYVLENDWTKPKHIDPKLHPLTPDMVGRVVLVDECNVMALMYIYFDGKQGRRFNYSYASDGVNLGGTLDKSNIKYYYFIR